MEKIFDISRKLNPSIATWSGDHKFKSARTLEIKKGASVNLSSISMSIHTGTHVDAPYHFLEKGAPIDQLEISPFWGIAQVVTVAGKSGPLQVEDFSHIDLSLAPRILVRTMNSEQIDVFPTSISYPSLELVDLFAEHELVLYGVDAPSVDKLDSKSMAVHKALWHNQIHILEGITLANVPNGIYELAAIPLNIEGVDGSPVRAVLRTIDN